jgi:hypothetical protein
VLSTQIATPTSTSIIPMTVSAIEVLIQWDATRCISAEHCKNRKNKSNVRFWSYGNWEVVHRATEKWCNWREERVSCKLAGRVKSLQEWTTHSYPIHDDQIKPWCSTMFKSLRIKQHGHLIMN